MSETIWFIGGVLVGVFHAQLWAATKPLIASGWKRYQDWRASRNA